MRMLGCEQWSKRHYPALASRIDIGNMTLHSNHTVNVDQSLPRWQSIVEPITIATLQYDMANYFRYRTTDCRFVNRIS